MNNDLEGEGQQAFPFYFGGIMKEPVKLITAMHIKSVAEEIMAMDTKELQKKLREHEMGDIAQALIREWDREEE